MKKVYLLATLDTKGVEADFIRRQLAEAEIEVCIVDAGCIGEPLIEADIKREVVFEAASHSLGELIQRADRGDAISAASDGTRALMLRELAANRIAGVIALGGSAGTTIGTAAMRALPIGLPKLMISTLASGQVRPYIGDKDILMMNSVVDIAGLNRISRVVLANASAAMIGMVKADHFTRMKQDQSEERPLVAATMFGVTTPCVEQARKIIERGGYEVLVFHATGNGGQAMESLIREGAFAGVLDITTTELADELVGGVLSAGPERLTAASDMGIPQVVSVGATDMVNFGAPETIPETFKDRKLHRHNATVTLMRTTEEECEQLGKEIGRKVASSKGPAAIMLPLHGVSAIDKEQEDFDDPFARAATFAGIAEYQKQVELNWLDMHINDKAFATACAEKLLQMLPKRATPDHGNV